MTSQTKPTFPLRSCSKSTTALALRLAAMLVRPPRRPTRGKAEAAMQAERQVAAAGGEPARRDLPLRQFRKPLTRTKPWKTWSRPCW